MKFEPWLKAYELLNKRLTTIYPSFGELHIQLRKGGILISYKAYVAFMVFVSILTLLISTVVSFIMVPLVVPRIGYISLLNFVICLVVGPTAAMVSMLVMYIYPGMKAANRKGPIDRNMPYITNFLTLLSSSNVPPSMIFKSMSNISTLKEVRLEFSNVVRDVEIFGNDLMSAVNENARLAASDQLRDVLIGYVATIRTGGNPAEYLKVTSEKITRERITKLDSMLESLSAMAEIYVMLLVAAPLLFVVLFVTLGMIGGGAGFGGISMSLLLYLGIYLGIPILGIVMMVMMSTFEK
jgi:archaeal flagellar protein FlaJ